MLDTLLTHSIFSSCVLDALPSNNHYLFVLTEQKNACNDQLFWQNKENTCKIRKTDQRSSEVSRFRLVLPSLFLRYWFVYWLVVYFIILCIESNLWFVICYVLCLYQHFNVITFCPFFVNIMITWMTAPMTKCLIN